MSDPYASSHAANDPERESGERLSRLHGPAELQAALLAMLVPAGNPRANRAWELETAALQNAEGLRQAVSKLSGASRLPWFERLLSRMAKQPLAARQDLLMATRRIMNSQGVARPIDRLNWLAIRRGLGEVPQLAARSEAADEVAEWLESDVLALAAFTAFLSRMVPGGPPESVAGVNWYANVMSAWTPFADPPPCEPPEAERMVEALGRLQTLSMMQRPVVVRSWVTAAMKLGSGIRLDDTSADALRLSCTLLDTPLPPELARHCIALEAEGESR